MNFFWAKIKSFWKYFQTDHWILKKYEERKLEIIKLWKKIAKLSDQEIKTKTTEFIKRHQNNEPLESLMNEAYAVAAEAILRVTKIKLHPVQIIGSIILHFGDIAEMKTGEGKTLSSVLPAYLNSFVGKTVYIVTVNEYLVNRDFKENDKIFKFLNVSVGKTLNNMNHEDKKNNYLKSIIYGTNSEFGFDYLRDNMKNITQEKLQKDHFFVIIDEVDSVLIDEGRTPLIISGNPKNRTNLYQRVDRFVKTLKNSDFKIDSETKRCFLQKPGIIKANQNFNLKNLFDIENSELFHFISNSLQASKILQKNIDYLVKDKKILLIDQFTGRVTPDRMLSEGLHQSLEAKENCFIREETSILGTITYQNYFRLFDKISGMTGTAKNEEEEFNKLYNINVLVVATNEPVIRIDDCDFFFYNKKRKYLSLVESVKKFHDNKQPILIGTCSVKTSEEVSDILKKFGYTFQVLNAKQHEYEARLITNAGKNGAITIATNMAGRGTDIKLDEIAKKSGGLAVLGVERNESRRIDLQLQGRGGRQGEPGYSTFFVSLDDDLFLRFGNSYLKKIFKPLQDETLKSKLLSKTIKKAQKKLQNQSYDQRKNLLEYDNVISQQRRVFYKQRNHLINITNLDNYLAQLLSSFLQQKWEYYFANALEVNIKEVNEFFQKIKTENNFIPIIENIETKSKHQTWTKEETIELYTSDLINHWNKSIKNTSKYVLPLVKQAILEQMDHFWTHHLDELFRIKASSFLHGYAQKNPLQAFIEEAEQLFRILKKQIIINTVPNIFQVLIENNFIK